MSKNLVIVESPAKAKTIEKFLGKDYMVKSSFGHVRDLKDKELSIDVNDSFKPTYVVSADKKKIVTELKKLAKAAEMVWLASDEDREGEAISWHLSEELGLSDKNTKRIVFHEITKSAILNAIKNPRKIDLNLVDAQQARRVLDRLVGFEVSPVLWKKVKPSLSAGRVQSVAVRLIVEREKEIKAFKTSSAFKVSALFELKGKKILKAELGKRFTNEKDAQKFLESCKGAEYKITSIETKPGKKSPAAPFTTSTLQQEASRKLGYSVSQTMSIAQKLYESGKITYMRTDSVNLSSFAIDAAKAEIIKLFGADFANPRQFVTKSNSAQEAHEAIRPTDMHIQEAGASKQEVKLYDLIWKRTLASQMADAELERTTVSILVSTNKEVFSAQGEVLKFEGFLKVYMESNDDEEDEDQKGILPPMKVGEILSLNEIEAMERYTHHPARYSEASLVKKLEELGIGRPSTYAPTISTIQNRGYVEKPERQGEERTCKILTLKKDKITSSEKKETTGKEKGKLSPTDIGVVVNDFLVQHFDRILDYSFTAEVEKEFDEIAAGKLKWPKMIAQFYKPFHEDVVKTSAEAERASGERALGKDPKTGEPVIARLGRFGPMVQIGDTSDTEKKARFASIRGELSLSSITLEQALELFKLPRVIGKSGGEELTAAIGRFGPYIKFNNKFYSIPKDEDPLTLTLARSLELIKEKDEADANKNIASFKDGDDEILVLNGRFGAYIKLGKKNFKIPKGKKAEKLTLPEIKEIIETSKK